MLTISSASYTQEITLLHLQENVCEDVCHHDGHNKCEDVVEEIGAKFYLETNKRARNEGMKVGDNLKVVPRECISWN